MALESTQRLYRNQQRLISVAIAGARRSWRLGALPQLAATIAVLQLRAARDALAATDAMLAEQGMSAPPVADLIPAALAGVASDGRPLSTLFQVADSLPALEAMVRTQVADAGRVAQGVSTVVRPKLDGHTRFLNPPSCSRCAILAGRFYRWSTGFRRHPRCDCVMTPTTEDAADPLLTDPMEAFRAGQIHGMSEADVKAVNDGADLGKVVNVRSTKSGLSIAGRTVERGGKPTPEGIYLLASDRDQALSLLERYGYIR